MKYVKYFLLGSLFVLSVSCNDSFLERLPESELSPETYFKTENELISYTNSFYPMIRSWEEIWSTRFGDDEARFSVDELKRGNRTVPTTGGGWTWTDLRKINFFLDNIGNFTGDESIKNKYVGMARFFRALFYFRKVKMFGDVPWYSHTLSTEDDGLEKARDPRSLVVDSILADLDFAADNLDEQRDAEHITKWTALALTSRVALFEGTFRKYHGLGNAEEMLSKCVSASNALMQNSGYEIYKSTPANAYYELFSNKDPKDEEIILAKEFDFDQNVTDPVDFRTNSSSYGRPGVTKAVINSYLMKDGSRFTDLPGHNKMVFKEEVKNRDPRLTQTIVTPGNPHTDRTVPDFTACLTGYQYIKYIGDPTYFNSGSDYALPVYRYAEVLLNDAEAKAELGTITQSDLDQTIGRLRDRVGMPNLILADANANPDPFLEKQYPNVTGANKGVILEIRRERRIELLREGFRQDDLMRWKAGPLFASTSYGLYFPGAGNYDLDGDGDIDFIIYENNPPSSVPNNAQVYSLESLHLENGKNGGRIIVNGDIVKAFDEDKDYLYPLPLQDLLLNKNLEQNPGWDSQ